MHEHKVVTAHAILRWLERVEKFDLHPVKVEMRCEDLDTTSPREILHYLWRTRGIKSADIAKGMISPEVLQAISVGAVRVKHRGEVLLIRGGRIATVVTKEMHAISDVRKDAEIKRRKQKSRVRADWNESRRQGRYAADV